ncbi:MAG: DUF1566 domain-containing protein [Gammaproteobacteria bacterium]
MPRADARLRLALVLAAPLVAGTATADDPRYQRLDARGAQTGDDSAWQCTRDAATGLSWEVKTADGGLRDRRWTYTPYDGNPATNGGYPGYRDTSSGKCVRARMRGGSCNTEAYVEAVNAQGLCGHRDWRLPTYTELAGIAPETTSEARGATPLALPDTEEGWYWTAVAKIGVTSFSRVVLLPPRARPQFYDGSYLVMLVRDP